MLFEGTKLMVQNDLARWLNSEAGGKNLTWNNYFIDIEDNSTDGGKGSKKY